MIKIHGTILALGLFLTSPVSLAGSGIFGLQCGTVKCNVNYLPNTQTATSISLVATGMSKWLGYSLVLGVNQGYTPLQESGVSLQYDGTLYSVVDIKSLPPGHYSFAVFPATSRNQILGNGAFTIVGEASAPTPTPSNSLIGSWVSVGLLVPTPLVINSNGTYQFGPNSGSYQPTATGGVFSGLFASMSGGQAVLANGTLQFRAPVNGTASSWYTFRRQ